ETHADANGKVYAHLDGSVTTAKTLKISANGTESANANSKAVVGGILADVDHDGATATVTPDIEAYVSSGGSINIIGNLEIAALADPEADALTKGIGVSGVAAIGDADSTATSNPTVKAYIDPPTVTVGGSVSVTATAESKPTKTLPNYQIVGTNTGDALSDPLNNTVTVTNHGLLTGDTVQLPTNAGIGGLTVNEVDVNPPHAPIAIIKTVIAVDGDHLAFGDVFDGATVDPTTDIIT